MLSKLIAILGPLKGGEFTLSDETLSIGRDPSNALSIADPLVSQQHCTIERDPRGILIRDLESLNGTMVNGSSVKESRLEHGDRIKVGGTHFVLLGPGETGRAGFELEDWDPADQETLQVRYGETRYHQTDQPLSELATAARIASDLDTMLRISNSINAVRDPEALQWLLLELVFDSIPADRGAILLTGHREDAFVSKTQKRRGEDGDSSFGISRTIVNRVREDVVAVLSNGIAEGEDFEPTESLIASNATSVLCVPLVVFNRMLGVIYLVGSDPNSRFDEEHLHLLTGIAGAAAVALEHARYVEWLEGENRRLNEEIQIDHDMVGEGARMQKVYQFIGKAAPSDATVLIRGESGTGKELVARALHSNSNRSDKPFVAINCAA